MNRRIGIHETQDLKAQIKNNYILPYSDILKKEEDQHDEDDYYNNHNNYRPNFNLELKKGTSKKDYIVSLFHQRLFAELYFAWCKDCQENISIENAKYFRDELLIRNNKDRKNFNFKSLRIGKFFLMAFLGNLESSKINKINFADNLITDICMHTIKSIISSRKVNYLDLSSNMISTEGLKIFQNEVIQSDSLKYLNVNNFLI